MWCIWPKGKRIGRGERSIMTDYLRNIFRAIKSRRLRWTDYAAKMKEGKDAFKILESRPTGKTNLERPRRRWENNIRGILKKWV